MPTSLKLRHRVNSIPVSQPICQLKSFLTPYTDDGEAFAMLNATKTNVGVRSMAAQSGFTADECHYILMTKDKVHYDGVHSDLISDKPTVVIQCNQSQSVHFPFLDLLADNRLLYS